jgi:hypothetical protein
MRGGALAAATLLLGAATGVLTARSGAGFRDVLEPVQLAVSVLVPFFGVLAVTHLHGTPRPVDRRHSRRPLLSVTIAVGFAISLAAAFALAGALLAAAATRWAGGDWPPPTRGAELVLAAVAVQVIAQLTGTGWGLLVRRPAVAMAATIVVPLGITALLGAISPHGNVARWLTPYGNARSLLDGAPGPGILPGLCVVVLLWCVVPNVLGARKVRGLKPFVSGRPGGRNR